MNTFFFNFKLDLFQVDFIADVSITGLHMLVWLVSKLHIPINVQVTEQVVCKHNLAQKCQYRLHVVYNCCITWFKP